MFLYSAVDVYPVRWTAQSALHFSPNRDFTVNKYTKTLSPYLLKLCQKKTECITFQLQRRDTPNTTWKTSGSLGYDGPSKGERHFGYDVFALFEQHRKKPSYPRAFERRPPTWGKTVPRRILPHIFPRHIIAVYVVANNVQYHIYRNAIVEGQW